MEPLAADVPLAEIRGQILGQPIQQVRVPSLLLHVVHRLDEPPAHKPLPQPIDQRPRKPPVLPLGDDLRQSLEPGRSVSLGVDSSQFRVKEFELGVFAGRLVATDHFQRSIGVDPGQPVGIGQRQVVDKAVMAGGALKVHAHEHLGDVLRGLHLRRLAGRPDGDDHRSILKWSAAKQVRRWVVASPHSDDKTQPCIRELDLVAQILDHHHGVTLSA